MKRILACMVALAPWVADAQQLNLKIGAWEMTHKGSVFPKPLVEKTCLTRTDLAQLASGPDKDDDKECKFVRPPALTGNKWVGDKVCSDGRKVHAEVVAESPERVKGTMVSSGGGKTVSIDTSGRWLGASCAGID